MGGLALAVGILVDDATVTIENIERFLEEGLGLKEAITEGAAQISVPALVSTLCICIVFLPMFFLSGVAKYLFVPLAEAVVFAMLASYILSRTLVPTLAMYLLRSKQHGGRTRNPLVIFQRAFERGFERVRASYQAAAHYTRLSAHDLCAGVFACVSFSHAAAAVSGSRLLPNERYRPVQTPRPGEDRDADRRGGKALGHGRQRYPERDS